MFGAVEDFMARKAQFDSLDLVQFKEEPQGFIPVLRTQRMSTKGRLVRSTIGDKHIAAAAQYPLEVFVANRSIREFSSHLFSPLALVTALAMPLRHAGDGPGS
ncbi:MAG: hypothetical protein DHS20C16_11280 [Phycisphaerae bacterium]|nr:MAG: hypothetical protein DHS20C16_11280 [Phycisphaerae bacterium]